jgi:hypothetical protein
VKDYSEITANFERRFRQFQHLARERKWEDAYNACKELTRSIEQVERWCWVKAYAEARPCTCHPDDNPPRPCAQKYALSECRAAQEHK